MKLMIVSDIHGSYVNLKKVLDIYEEEQMDGLVLLGDLLYHGPRNPLPEGYDPKAVAALLNAYKNKIICSVRGNCDSEVDQMMIEFPILADYSQIYIDGHRLFLTHGHLFDHEHLPPLNPGDAFIHGHFHKPVATKVDDIVIFNPSSISLPKAKEKSFGVYEDHYLSIFTLEKELVERIKL